MCRKFEQFILTETKANRFGESSAIFSFKMLHHDYLLFWLDVDGKFAEEHIQVKVVDALSVCLYYTFELFVVSITW